MANVIFDSLKTQLVSEAFDWEADDIRVILMKNTYTPAASQATYGAIKSHEIDNGGGYTTGGVALTGKTAALASNAVTFDANDVVWSNSTISNALYAVLIKNAGGSPPADASPLLAAYDFGVAKSSSNDNFTFAINASGLLVLS